MVNSQLRPPSFVARDAGQSEVAYVRRSTLTKAGNHATRFRILPAKTTPPTPWLAADLPMLNNIATSRCFGVRIPSGTT